jgi:hypothetical protein
VVVYGLWAMCQPVAYVSHHRPYSVLIPHFGSPVERIATAQQHDEVKNRTEKTRPAATGSTLMASAAVRFKLAVRIHCHLST